MVIFFKFSMQYGFRGWDCTNLYRIKDVSAFDYMNAIRNFVHEENSIQNKAKTLHLNLSN